MFVNEAWKIVKSGTITNCWKKTGILPNFEDYDSDQEDIDDIDEITSELQDMINELNLEDFITAEEFIHIDDEIPIEQLSDEDILAAIIPNAENDDAEDDETPEEINIITNREALNSLEKVIKYFKNPPDNITTNYTELKTLNTLRSKINRQIQDNAKQTTLDSYLF
jgi:hypothetical protein